MTTNLKDKILNLKGPIFVFGASGFIGVNLFKDIFLERRLCPHARCTASMAIKVNQCTI